MKKGLIDLHVHTKFSGENIITDAPTILRLALANGVQTLSITDHNSAEGCREALEYINKNKNEYKDFRFIPGIEITCDTASVDSYMENGTILRSTLSGGVHILGYGIDPYNPRYRELERFYASDQGKRVLGVYKFISRYYNLQLDKNQILYVLSLPDTNAENILMRCVSLGDKAVFKKSNEYFRFWHDNVIAKPEEYQAFKHRINGCLNCLPDELDGYAKQDIYEMIDLIESTGGVAVLAHPTIYRPKMELAMSDFALLRLLVDKLTMPINQFTGKPMRGIVGLEMLHGRSFDEQFKYKFFDNLIKEKGLFVTGGSDAHITKKRTNFVGVIRQNYSIVDLSFVRNFDVIQASKSRIKNFNNIERQATLKNDYQIIKPSEIIQGRTISEKLARFEREIAMQVYFLKNLCKNGNIELYYEQVQKMEYWSWVYSIYFSSIMENKKLLFDDMDAYYGWLNERKQFFDEIEQELYLLGKIKGVTIKHPKEENTKLVINYKHPFEKTKQTLEKISKMIDGENDHKHDNFPHSIAEMIM